MKFSSAALATSAAASKSWVFEWPYTVENGCVCSNSSTQPSADGRSFLTEEECVFNFGESPYEYCGSVLSDDGSQMAPGLDEAECEHAVTVTVGLTNGDCRNKCTSVVAGTLPVSDFFDLCRLEYVVDFGGDHGVAPVSAEYQCFSNNVYGWADYDYENLLQAPPLKIFSEVASAAICQDLCQQVPECAAFNWKAPPTITPLSEEEAELDGEICLLYDSDYMRRVLEHTVNENDELQGSTPYCNVHKAKHCPKAITLFPDYAAGQEDCLFCGCDQPKCVWKEPRHITGPAFCSKEASTDFCSFDRPVWTTTPAPCTVPDESTTQPEETSDAADLSTTPGAGTAETDIVTTAESADSTTQATTSEGDSYTTSEAGTAETDTATTAEADHSTSPTEETRSTSGESSTTLHLSEITAEESSTTLSLSETTTAISLSSTFAEDETTTSPGVTDSESATSEFATEGECGCNNCPCMNEGMDDSIPDDDFVNDDCFPDC